MEQKRRVKYEESIDVQNQGASRKVTITRSVETHEISWEKEEGGNKEFQQFLLNGPVMDEEAYEDYLYFGQ